MDLNIGCSTLTFPDQSLESALTAISDAGFDMIDIVAVPGWVAHMDLDDAASPGIVAAAVERSGLHVSSLNCVPRVASTSEAQTWNRTLVALKIAEHVGAPIVSLDCGPEGGDVTSWAAYLARAADEASRLGIEVVVEAPHYGLLAATVDESMLLMDLAGGLRMTYDPSHIAAAGETAAETLDRAGDRIAHVHVRDGRPGSYDVDPGDGDYDFVTLTKWLRRSGVDAVVELLGGKASPERARKAANFMRSLAE